MSTPSSGDLHEDVQRMSVAELKDFLTERGVDFSGVLEKAELQRLANQHMTDAPPAPPAPEEAGAAPSEPSSEAVATFMSITGAGPDAAAQFLEMMNGEVEAAVNVFMETGGSESRPRVDSSFSAPRSATFSSLSDGTAGVQTDAFDSSEALDETMDEDEDGEDASMQPAISAAAAARARRQEAAAARRAAAMYAPLGSEPARPTAADMPVDEHGVRAAIPQYKERLVQNHLGAFPAPMGMGGQAGDIPLFRAETEDNTNWMFPPPRDLSFPAPFLAARQAAREQRKWLLVNIQDAEIFQSHELNRDTWSDETIVELIRTSFLFWQRTTTSGEGKLYTERYRLRDSQKFPHIAIIDPRTGAQMLELSGFVHPEELCSLIMDFLGSHSLEDTEAKETKTVRVSDGWLASTPGLKSGDHEGQAGSTEAMDEVADSKVGLPSPKLKDDANNDAATPGSIDQAAAAAAAEEEESRMEITEDDLVPEPPQADKSACRLRIQFPNGGKVQRRFPATATVGDVKNFVRFHMKDWEQPYAQFELSTNFPRKKYEDDSETLDASGLAPQAMLYLRNLDA